MTRKPRSSETEEERQKRLDETARKRGEDSAASDDAVDKMVRLSIKDHGP
jgi:hypothetical protein